MSWLKKFTGADGQDRPQREFERVTCTTETIEILIDHSAKSGTPFKLLDFSLGGFAITGYEGPLRGNKYFEFKFCGELDDEAVEIKGFANVVRVNGDFLAAKFTPQPALKKFLKNYIANR